MTARLGVNPDILARTAKVPWVTYTPTNGATGWSLGDGTLAGSYRTLSGNTWAVRINLSVGTTTNVGSTAWTFSLPSGLTAIATFEQALVGSARQASTGVRRHLVGIVSGGGTTIASVSLDNNANAVAGTVPWGWVAGDRLVLQGILEGQ